VDCVKDTYANQTTIQRLSGQPKYLLAEITVVNNETNVTNVTKVPFHYNTSREYGDTVLTEFEILCEMTSYTHMPRLAHFAGYIVGALVLGFASDRGGRKMIVLSCIWVSGVMSIFQLVGHDFISFTFFQFFIGLFLGGVQASFLPAIIEMFPIKYRTFYGTFFHLVISLFELVLPWLAKSFRSWRLLQIFVTAPIALTAVLHWFVYESIFWYLAHKEYDKAIQVLTKLAKRNGLNFESKFKQAKEFLHAKHSKATQVDIMPLMRLQDIDLLGKKYPQVDMAELQKQKSNNSKLRRFLNSLKGESYRSTNTIYMPLDFVYSPTMLVYVLILAGLWLTNGFTDSMEIIKKPGDFDHYIQSTFANLSYVVASALAIVLALLK
jgi:MFS family permease